MLLTIATDMGLDDPTIRLEPLKLLVYCTRGHLTDYADTEKTPGMIASNAVIVSGACEGGALGVEHAGAASGPVMNCSGPSGLGID